MLDLLFLEFLLPLAGFFALSVFGNRIKETSSAIIGVGSVGLSALVALGVGYSFLTQIPAGGAFTQTLWSWINVSNLGVHFALRLDVVSLVMTGIVTGVGFLIHLFASWYMRGEEGYARFFAYMNLFIASMLFLVLGSNLLFLYFGWEGVGLCSYLLIGFYYRESANGFAARKAFVITRVGDTSLAIGLFLIFQRFHTLNIQQVLSDASQHWATGSDIATITAFLILGGAVGKSAQLPLQTWLPDAMAGPTPISALIHAATMVTAGVYLIARTHTIFQLAPVAQEAVGVVGALTLLMAGFCALAQTDIKRVLAYSTMSQIGYMFLALGVGAWSDAIFHLMSHAFFKSLLFLGAGSIIIACHHEQDMFKMGGLRKRLPLTFWSFLIGSAALAALPPTDGFFSKDAILHEAWVSGHPVLWGFGTAGAFVTAVYTSRMVLLTFFGEYRGHAEVVKPSGIAHGLPLLGLSIAALFGGIWGLNLNSILPVMPHGYESPFLEWLPLGLALIGVALSWYLFQVRPQATWDATHSGLLDPIRRWWFAAFGFDWLYDLLFMKPFLWLVRGSARDWIDRFILGIPKTLRIFNNLFARTETGLVRWYAASVGIGAVLILAAVLYS